MSKQTPMPKPSFGDELMFPGRFAAADDLGGQDRTLEIESIKRETLKIVGADDEQKWVIQFRGAKKKFIVNKTNSGLIAQATGELQAKNWPGKRITLYPTTVDAFGERWPCIRVRPTAPKPPPKQPPPVAPTTDSEVAADSFPVDEAGNPLPWEKPNDPHESAAYEQSIRDMEKTRKLFPTGPTQE